MSLERNLINILQQSFLQHTVFVNRPILSKCRIAHVDRVMFPRTDRSEPQLLITADNGTNFIIVLWISPIRQRKVRTRVITKN
jgi:hypothetical protein